MIRGTLRWGFGRGGLRIWEIGDGAGEVRGRLLALLSSL
jgi:hypothetical protein